MSRKIIKDFEAELATLKQKQALLENEIQTIERMIRKAKGEAEIAGPAVRKRQNVKGIVYDLLKERADIGLTPQTAVDLAAQRGVNLEKTTVSSLLSRLKNDGVVQHDGAVYRIAQQAKAPSSAAATEGVFH